MPIQAPQWTEFLSCPVCYTEFDEDVCRPISLGCGHTVCKMCLGQLHRKQCPFDQTEITCAIAELPANYALLQLIGAKLGEAEEEMLPKAIAEGDLRHYAAARSCVEDLAWYLKPSDRAGFTNSSGVGCVLSKPMQRKLVALINCQLVEEEGRSRAVRAARSLGERTVTELILQHQNQQQLSANLWAAVRSRGCQFLGPAMQEETLKLVLLALEDGAALSRKVLVMFVVQKLEQQFPQASKTSVGHVVQLLYRASCFIVTKRDEESSLMQLKDEFRNYEGLRREHDAQIVQIATEAGLRISPEQWSSLLYGDLNHKSHMQSIIDKLQTPASFATSIQELTIALQRSGDRGNLASLIPYLDQLSAVNPNPDSNIPSWSDIEKTMFAVKTVVHGLVEFVQNHNLSKKAMEQQTQNIKYKTSLCRDVTQKVGCPRGNSCTFAHSEEELERHRAKSRRLISALNRRTSPQSKPSERGNIDMFIGRGVIEDSLLKEDHSNLQDLQQHNVLQNKREATVSLAESTASGLSTAVTGNSASLHVGDTKIPMPNDRSISQDQGYSHDLQQSPIISCKEDDHTLIGTPHQQLNISHNHTQSYGVKELPSTLQVDSSSGRLFKNEDISHRLHINSNNEGIITPWANNTSLTNTVSSLWTIPTVSVAKNTTVNQEDSVLYNPWTSQAPFCLVRPVKETNTNYTMTYIKAHVRHMSVEDHHTTKDKPMGTHELADFKKMSLKDLEETLQKVKQEDKHAGSCHYERSHIIQLEMDRRVQQKDDKSGPLANSVREEPRHGISAAYTSEGEQGEMMRYYQKLPLNAQCEAIKSHQGHNPIAKSSRTASKSTGPVQVSAGPSLETNPVTLTQDCLVAPSFQSSPCEDYHRAGLHSSGESSHTFSTSLAASKWQSKTVASKDV